MGFAGPSRANKGNVLVGIDGRKGLQAAQTTGVTPMNHREIKILKGFGMPAALEGKQLRRAASRIKTSQAQTR